MTAQSSRAAISARLFADETLLVKELAAEALLSPDDKKRVADLAKVAGGGGAGQSPGAGRH